MGSDVLLHLAHDGFNSTHAWVANKPYLLYFVLDSILLTSEGEGDRAGEVEFCITGCFEVPGGGCLGTTGCFGGRTAWLLCCYAVIVLQPTRAYLTRYQL